MSVGFYYRCVVGETLRVGLLVGCLEQLNVKALWGLHQTIVAAEHILLRGDMAQGLDNRCHRDDGLLGACCLEAMANDLDVDKRTHTIVHTNDAFGVWN